MVNFTEMFEIYNFIGSKPQSGRFAIAVTPEN
jgi:hypothetical protein